MTSESDDWPPRKCIKIDANFEVSPVAPFSIDSINRKSY